MSRDQWRSRAGCKRAGLSLVEVMIALAITAMLLTATAVALDASIKAYQINVQQAMILQMERVTMNRILSTIRRSKLHAPDDPTLSSQFATGKTVTGTAIAMFDINGVATYFRYDATNKVLDLVIGTTSHPLAHGVDDFQITMEPMRSETSTKTGGTWDLLKRATILLTVETSTKTSFGPEDIGSVKLSLSASVMPRRNSW